MSAATRRAPLLMLLALAACKGENATTPAASDWPSFDAPATAEVAAKPLPAACSLVTGDEAAVVLGQTVGQMSDEPENCIWASAENPAYITMLMVQLSAENTPAQAETMFNAMTNTPGTLNAMVNEQIGERTRKSGQEIDLGDAAWRSASNAGLVGTQQLVVRKGTVLLSLNITGMTKTGKLEGLNTRLEAAARTALTRL